jgi:hypothetical protein
MKRRPFRTWARHDYHADAYDAAWLKVWRCMEYPEPAPRFTPPEPLQSRPYLSSVACTEHGRRYCYSCVWFTGVPAHRDHQLGGKRHQ